MSKPFTHWKCPGCSWTLTETEYRFARFDFTCAGCKKHCLSDFIGTDVPKAPTNAEAKPSCAT